MSASAVTNQYTNRQNNTQNNHIQFTGLFKKAKTVRPFMGKEEGMSGYDYMISLKVADILHRLDETSILVIGTDVFSIGKVRAQLTREDSELKNPKDIKVVYMINHNSTDTMIIQKLNQLNF